jgi:hypothetical protein
MSPKFHERFGIELGVAEAKRRFVNRALNFIFDHCMKLAFSFDRWAGRADLAKYICSKLGERYSDHDKTEKFMQEDFDKCLIILEALYHHRTWSDTAAKGIQALLSEAEVDLGIRWENGQFRPAGAPALDQALVSDPLNLFGPEYKGVSEAFQKGLDHFLHSTKKPELLADTLTDMYEALEALAKIVCDNEKDLSANRESFVSNVRLADQYKRMLKEYLEYANKFGRHAGPQGMPKPLPSRKEVEAFMYLTGLFIRVTVSKDA